MDAQVPHWRETLPRRGAIEVGIGAIVKHVIDSKPSEWWLEPRKSHSAVQRERAVVERQGFDATELRAFDFRRFRGGQIMLTSSAATRFAVQNKITRQMGRAVPYPTAGPSKQPKKEALDPEFDAMEKQPISF